MKTLVSDKCIQSSEITFANHTNVISDDFKLAQTFKNYLKGAAETLRIKEHEANSDMNVNARSKDGVDVAIEKHKDHPSMKIINENLSSESRFSFKKIWASDIQNEFSYLNSEKAATSENIPTEVLKDSSKMFNSLLQDVWDCEMIGKQHFP